MPETATLETVAAPVEVAATGITASTPVPAVVPVSTNRPSTPPLTLGRIASMVASANRGEISTDAVRSTLHAALANVTTTDVGAIVQPFYRSEITGLIDHGTPLLNVLSGGVLPASGMAIEFPRWKTLPTTGIQATEKTQIVSTPAQMEMDSSPVITIAGGNDISLQAVQRSSPSFLEAYLRAASVDWARKASAYVYAQITAEAVAATPGTSFLENVQALLGALDPAVTPGGPLFVGMAYDVALPLISVPATEGPAFWNGSINFGSMVPNVNADGLTMFVDPSLPAGTMVGGSRQAATVYKSAGAPADIRVVDVSLLGLDVGVYGFLAVTIEYPEAIATLTVTPTP